MSTNSLRPPRNYHRLAWMILLGAFVLFWVLAMGGCYGLFQLRSLAASQPERPAFLTTYVRDVEIYRSGLVQPEKPTPPAPTLYQGDAVRVGPLASAGVGAAVTIFDGSVIELWPDTQITLDEIQTTRFNNRSQRVRIRLERGMMRIRLVEPSNQLYTNVDYTVLIERPGQPIEQAVLGLGGLYRIRLLDADAATTSLSEQAALSANALQAEYVAERGSLLVESGQMRQEIVAGQKLLADAQQLATPQPATWQLLRDGDFMAFSSMEYNNTTQPQLPSTARRSDTWIVSGEPYPGATIDGFFEVIHGGCLAWDGSPDQSACTTEVPKIAEFRRMNPPGHKQSFRTAITQTVSLDATPYAELSLKFSGRIIYQSISLAGFIGEECALGVQLRYTTIKNEQASHTLCYYAFEDPAAQGVISNKPYITSIRLEPMQWSQQSIDLKTLLPDLQRLEVLEFYGNGHDYQAQTAAIRLVAR